MNNSPSASIAYRLRLFNSYVCIHLWALVMFGALVSVNLAAQYDDLTTREINEAGWEMGFDDQLSPVEYEKRFTERLVGV